MRSTRAASTLLLLCILYGITVAQPRSQTNPWFFIQITDPQFGMFEKNEGFDKETLLYEKAVAGINKLDPDFVVITGDFVHDPKAEAQIEEFRRITEEISPDIPVYFTPGNHDVGQEPDKQSLRKYKRNYGKDRFSFRHKDSWIIGFNTSLIKADLPVHERKQYTWLKKELKRSRKSLHVILFCHYPFFIRSVDEPEAYSNIGPESREMYLSLFAASEVDAVFSGHFHNNAVARYGDSEMVITSALGKPLGDAPSGMQIVRIYNDRIEHKYVGLDELPDSVIFD